MSQWKWGHEHVALLQHRVYSHMPLLDRLSDLSHARRAAASIRSTAAAASNAPADRPFARTHRRAAFAASTISPIPTSSRFIIATGESGHIFSPHYRDLAPLWIAGKSITLAGSEDDLKRAGAKELTLTPR